MESDDSWQVRDLAPEVRETAREAARRRGMTVSQWLQSVIVDSAADDPTSRSRPSREIRTPRLEAANDRVGLAQGINERLDALSEQLSRLGRTGVSAPTSTPAPSGADPDFSANLQAIEGRLSALGRAAEASGPTQQLVEVLADLNIRLDRLIGGKDGRRGLEGLKPAFSTARTRLDYGIAATSETDIAPALPTDDWATDLDQAAAEISLRQRTLEPGADTPELPVEPPPAVEPVAAFQANSGALTDLQDRLGQLTEELRILRQPGGFTDSVQAMRQELVDIGRSLSDAAPLHAMQALETEIRSLGVRVDRQRQDGAVPADLAAIEQALGDMHEALRSMTPAENLTVFRDEVRALDRKIEQLLTQGPGLAAAGLPQVQRSIAELREIAARAASGDALVALAEEVQSLGEKIERSSAPELLGSDLVASLDRRFQALTADLNARGSAAGGPAADNLVSIVESLSHKIDTFEIGRDSLPALDTIVAHLTRLAERIEDSGARLDQLDHIERSFNVLLDRMDALRADTLAAAVRVAREAASEYVGYQPRADIEVDAIKTNLDSLRQHQAQTDRRTHDTLEAVHDTLERLVDRLAAVETGIRGDGGMRVVGPRALDTVQPPLEMREAGPAVTAETRNRSSAGMSSATIVPDRRPIDPALPADYPLEPGAGHTRLSPAAERIAASEAALGPAKPAPQADAKSDFIAAARRAAQAAASLSAAPDSDADGGKSEPSGFGSLAQRITRRRPLLLGAAFIICSGSLYLTLTRINVDFHGLRANIERMASDAIRSATKPAAKPRIEVAAAEPDKPVNPKPSSDIAAEAAPSSAAPPPPDVTAVSDEKSKPREPAGVSSVSPLTIASIQIPTGDLTGSLGRATGLDGRPGPAAAMPPLMSSPGVPNQVAPLPAALRSAAAAGDPRAEYEVAVRYAEGRGVPLNFEEAARWFERAATRNLPPAQYRLGSLYEKGQGVKKDLDQARRLYRAAADAGHGKAMHNLAVLYAEGVDGKPDYRSAAHWFRKAAERGVADSQFNLGILHARGLGVEQNLAESYKWFALASDQGDKDAGKKRDEVASRLDQTALVAARLAVQTFTAEPQPEDAITVKAPPGGWEAVQPPAPPAKSKTPRRVGP